MLRLLELLPTGKFYVFSVLDEDTNLINLWAVREGIAGTRWMRSEPEQLTFGPVPFRIPTLSKNGDRIFALGEQLKGELQVLDAASGLFGPYLAGNLGWQPGLHARRTSG